MRTNKRITIGLSVYNEENNIESVLADIISQKINGGKIKEILIFNDGSSDDTLKKIKRMNIKRIKIINDGKRLGKTHRLNQMFRKFDSDILIMFDGDIRIKNNKVISNLLSSFSDSVMLVGGNSMPFHPKNFVEKAVNSTFNIFYKSRKFVNDGNNVFGSTGSILAIRSELAKQIRIPKIINEDTFIYMYCISKGYKFKYNDKAVVYYKLPRSIKDYIKQVFRSDPRAATYELDYYFGNLVKREFHRPLGFYLKSILRESISNPLGITFVIFVNLFCKMLTPLIINNYKLDWFTASTTKVINTSK